LQGSSLTLVYIIVLMTIILLAYLVNRRRKLSFNFDFKLNRFYLLPLILLILFAFQIGINLPVQKIINSLVFNEIIVSKIFYSSVYIIGALSFGPILEEVLFRGIILKGLLSNYKPWKAILISAVIFGIIHGQPLMIPGAILFGICFGYLYYKTNSLGITILCHFTTNLFGMVGSYLNYRFGKPNFKIISDLYGNFSLIFIIVLAIMFIISSYFLVKKLIKNQLFLSIIDNYPKS